MLALAGEVGEAVNVSKKLLMTELKPEWFKQVDNPMPNPERLNIMLEDELSDAVFYLQAVADCLGLTLEGLIEAQKRKLRDKDELYQRTFLK